MTIKGRSFDFKFVFCTLVFLMVLLPFHALHAQDSEGTPIQQDVYVDWQILDVEDLPAQITVSLYDSESATAPLASQAFPKGQYAVDFEFNKSDGVTSGPIARIDVDFTNKLDMGDDPDNPNQVKEIWTELKINGQVVGDRTKVNDETLVRLLLASDAAIATYLTLAYEGDGNPITTIYKDLPLASGTSATDYITSVFGSVAASSSEISPASTTSPFWEKNVGDDNISYNDGNVGIGTSNPARTLHVRGSFTTLRIDRDADTVGLMMHRFPSGDFSTPWKGFLIGVAASGPNDGYFRISDYAQAVSGPVTDRFVIDNDGNVGIGLGATMPSNALDVFGTIRCKELIVTSTWADFVFQDNYKLPALDEVEDFISKNGHLPGIPSEAEVKEKGVSVGNISSKLLQKIEELTLYVIDLKKENNLLKGQLETIQSQLNDEKK